MMLDDITRLIAAGESETLELKKTTGERREAAKTVCAMLNNRGGIIFIGVTPEGVVTGQQVGERTIEDVSAEFQRIEPPAFPSIDRVPLAGGREVLVVRVNRGDMIPYRYRGNAYRRVGNTNWRMPRDAEDQMFLERVHGEQRWENQPAVGWSVDDLDLAELQRTVDESIRRGRTANPISREPNELLRGLGLVKDGVLLRAALVLFGNNARLEAEMPQCLLRVARFRGVGRTEFLDNRQFRGNAFALLSHAEHFLIQNLPVAGRVVPDSFVRVDEPLYPPLALREALANALCHRDYTSGGGSVSVGIYDDRLEITSTGPLHFGLTPALLFMAHESQPWNPLIANAFYRRGIIEQWGSGTIKMAELVTSAGLPQPEIEDVSGCVTVRFRPSRYVPPQRVGHDLTERQQVILALLNEVRKGLALREIHARLELSASKRQIREDLATLRILGLATPIGHGYGSKWKRLRAN